MTASLISFGSPILCIGTMPPNCSGCPSVGVSNIGVLIGPGPTAFTLIFDSAHSAAAPLVNPVTACFVELYTVRPGYPA